MSPRVEPRSVRSRRQTLMKVGVWIFLALFVFSVLGVGLMFTLAGNSR